MFMKKNQTARARTVSTSSTKTQAGSTVLDDIHQKIHNSAALNGGFDTLLHKIDKIEHGQGQLVSKVDKIHEAIYDPNEGVFSKLSEFKLENYQKFSEISQHMSEINEWKKHREKIDDKKEDMLDSSTSKIVYLENSVESLMKSKASTWSLVKWIAVAVGGGVVTILFKWIESKLNMGN